jgi:hypothetical protein
MMEHKHAKVSQKISNNAKKMNDQLQRLKSKARSLKINV